MIDRLGIPVAADFYFGYSQPEVDRLMAQAAVLRPITERLLQKAGLCAGMRVLDIGCGAGDVALAAAERVGPSGCVTGIDFAPKAVALARRRAAESEFDNIAFYRATDPECGQAEPFDFVVGRYVVLHQTDPVGFIRAAAAQLRRGGILAFHEVDLWSHFATLPPVPAFDQVAAEMLAPIRAAVPSPDAAARLISLFVAAGLAVPKLFCERLAGGEDDAMLLRAVATNYAAVRALTHPQEKPVSVDAVQLTLRDAVAATHSQILCPDQVCAWVKL
jgi:SAM-dependent methyltransferase